MILTFSLFLRSLRRSFDLTVVTAMIFHDDDITFHGMVWISSPGCVRRRYLLNGSSWLRMAVKWYHGENDQMIIWPLIHSMVMFFAKNWWLWLHFPASCLLVYPHYICWTEHHQTESTKKHSSLLLLSYSPDDHAYHMYNTQKLSLHEQYWPEQMKNRSPSLCSSWHQHHPLHRRKKRSN